MATILHETITIPDPASGGDREVNVAYQMTDFGIGSYEYWGSCGTDVRIEPEVIEGLWADTLEPVPTEVLEWINENMDRYSDELTPPEPPEPEYPAQEGYLLP